MKNLFLTAAMLLFFAGTSMSAQETPKKQHKTKSTTDTITKKQTTKGSKKNSTYKTDTLHKQRTDKTRPTTTDPATPRRDSTGTTTP